MTRFITLVLITALVVALGSSVDDAQGQSAPNEAEDREILDLVFEQIRLRARNPTLRVGRRESDPIAVLDHARPVCRQKVDPYEMSWPLMCGENPMRFLKGDLASVTSRFGLTEFHEVSRSELIRSFEERNQSWRPIAPIRGKGARSWPRERYFDLDFGPDDLVVFSLPGYSTAGHAIVYVDFSCGSTCGTFYIIALQRTDSTWKIVSPVVGFEIS